MKNVLIATTNFGKKKELENFLGNFSNIKFQSLADYPPIPDPEETGSSYEQNAELKAKYYSQAFNVPTISEDSGLEVEAFPSEFGIHTKRTIEAKDDIDWLRIFLLKMEEADNRNAKFVSSISFVQPGKPSITVLGESEGEITEFPQAPIEKGIPISAVFLPNESEEVFSCLTKSQKNKISHRGKAAQKITEHLRSL